MAEQRSCDICDNQAEYSTTRDSSQSWSRVIGRCPRCGEFEYDVSVVPKIRSPDEMVRLSGWVTPEILRRVSNMRLPGLRERASRVLVKLARDRSDALFSRAAVAQDLELQGRSYSLNEGAVDLLIRILLDDNSLRFDGGSCAVTPKGLLAAEALQAGAFNFAQGFVAMWFDGDLRDAWINGFDPGIRAAGFRPFRIDNKDYVGGITGEIMAEIRRSRFVVADYTGQVNGVYFEAGFALGLGLTVIPTCRADEIPKLHFDIKHLNTLLWNTPAELAHGLNKRIRAVIGAGPDAAHPI